MSIILVANPKGGSGKTTLATNLAGHYAVQGERVALGDMDRQYSSLAWLKQRPRGVALIQGWDARDEEELAPPRQVDRAILDSPAGLHGKRLNQAVKLADRVIVPVQPSVFDMWATEAFLATVLEEKAVRKRRTFVAVVGMRVDPRTRAAAMLEDFLARLDLPVLTYLRDTQYYMNAAAAGLTLFDLGRSRVGRDLEQWEPLLEWIDEADD